LRQFALILTGLLCGVGLAIWLGRRKGRNRFAAAVAQARAEGHADAKVELAATLANVVNVQVDGQRSGPRELTADDLYQAALARYTANSARDLGPGHDEFHDLDDLHNGSTRALGYRAAPAGQQFVDLGAPSPWDRNSDGDRMVSRPPKVSGL